MRQTSRGMAGWLSNVLSRLAVGEKTTGKLGLATPSSLGAKNRKPGRTAPITSQKCQSEDGGVMS